MKHIAAALLFCSTAIASAPAEQPKTIVVNVDTQQTMPAVSKYEYGMFIEHIRDSWYRGMWTQMLDDRKFYYPISSASPAAPAAAPQDGPPRGPQMRRWRPVGPDDAVAMDKHNPFVGDQSPRIQLDRSTAHGIRQSGIELQKGKRYVGYALVRATPGARINVSLEWGTGAGDRKAVPLAPASQAYRKIPFTFTAPVDSKDAALEITGIGSGDFHVGTVSLMPADNLGGFRPDSIALLRQINMGFWRYGGNYTSNLIWYHVVGDPDKRPPDFDAAWNAMQPNDLGLDEYMNLCKLIHVEPYISVNAGFGDSHSAAEEVEYMNGSTQTRMGALRARNGHPEPYHVKFWNIGNEPWGSWQLGRTDTKYFMLKHNEFAKAMRAVDPSIVLIASGRMLQEDALRGDERKNFTSLTPLFGTESDWTGSFLAHTFGNFDGIAEHWYAQPGRRFDMDKAKKLAPDASNEDAYVKDNQTLLESGRYAANVVLKKAEEWEGYEQRFPEMKAKNIFLSVDEYAYFGGGGFGRSATLRTALAYGLTFNEMLRHTDFLTMAAHTTGISMLDQTRTASTFSTVGLAFKLYADHFVGTIPVAITGNSPQPPVKYPAVGDQPDRTSGSPTYPLDMVATLSPDRKTLILSVVNDTESPHTFDLNLAGVTLAGAGTVAELTGASVDAANRAGQPAQVEINSHSTPADLHGLSVPPISISLFQIPLASMR